MALQPKTSVLIPSYKRPESLKNCLASLANQTHAPDEVFVVWQGEDAETRDAVDSFQQSHSLNLICLHLEQPGIVPAENLALDHSIGEIIFLIDDDAVAPADWIEKHLEHYQHPDVGAVGGPANNTTLNEGRLPKRSNEPVGAISWSGKVTGNMHDQIAEWTSRAPIEVDHLVGYNFSLRRSAFGRFEDRLKPYWQNFEMEACLQVQHNGFKVLFDFQNVVEHYPTNTTYAAGRNGDLQIKVLNSTFNRMFIFSKHFKGFRRLVVLSRQLLLGNVNSPGLLASFRGMMLYGHPVRELCLLIDSWKSAISGWNAGANGKEPRV